MFSNYLKIALRNLVRHKLYTFINICGLAVGLGLSLLIVSHITYELSFEDCHLQQDRIYRVNGDYISPEGEQYSARVMAPLGPAVVSELSDVEDAAVFRVQRIKALKIDAGERFEVHDPSPGALYTHHPDMIFANPGFLEVFTLPLVQGSPAAALTEPFSMLVTEEAALKYFKSPNPVGSRVKINDRVECQVTGILQDIPQNTQLHCDFLISYATLERIGEDTRSWDKFSTDYVYLLLNKDVDPVTVADKLPALVHSHLDPAAEARYRFTLQPLDDIYFASLGSGRSGELSPLGEASVIILYGFTILFILLQAVANFINLSTARSADRMREIGVRKVFGAFKGDLIKQFIGESIIIAALSMLLGIGVYEFLKLQVQDLLPREMLVEFYGNPAMLLAAAGLIIVVGVIAGYYPALHLSRFNPLKVLRSRNAVRSSKSWLRRGLVVFQFTLAIVFIISALTIYRQNRFVTSYNLGFNQDSMLVLDFEGENRTQDCQLMKTELLHNAHVRSASMTDRPLGRKYGSYCLFYTDEERQEEDLRYAGVIHGDADFLSTFNLEIVQGRGFTGAFSSANRAAVIVNQSTIDKLEIENPIGHRLYTKDGSLEIIGVVKDFYGNLLSHGSASKMFIRQDPGRFTSLVVSLDPDHIAPALQEIEASWKKILPSQPFAYTFLDDEIDANYRKYIDNGTIILALTFLSVAIACLGIFGLVAYTTGQRTKEIGIRKVMGSSVMGIVRLLSLEFVILIGIANLIAWPLGYFLMSALLQDFAVRVSLGWETFLLTGTLTILIALATVSFRTVRAAHANPVDSLRYE